VGHVRGSHLFALAQGRQYIIHTFFISIDDWLVGKINTLQVRINRYGPLHAGPWGLLQTVFDALKLLTKEDVTPAQADRVVFTLAPALVFLSAFLMFAVLPFTDRIQVADINVGVLFIIGISTLAAYGVLMAGWSISNKYGLIGGLRAAAQLVSYEVPLSLALLTVVLYNGSMSLRAITEAQAGAWFGVIPRWNIFPLFISFVIYFLASLAEIKSVPYDLPEAESELVAGFHTEYSGMRFALFFLAEFADLFLFPALATVFFLGGWNGPSFGLSEGSIGLTLLRLFYFSIKTAALVYATMWIRGTLPRYRDDQLMELSWKGLIPWAFAGLAVAVVLKGIQVL